jgi:hypothetical protein
MGLDRGPLKFSKHRLMHGMWQGTYRPCKGRHRLLRSK